MAASAFSHRVRVFRQLHESGCFVIPNPWDVGSARLLARCGFAALATTSAGCAWSLGRPDGKITLEECLEQLRTISASVELPVNADFEGGFAIAPEDVANNVTMATRTGIAGLSIEDSTTDAARPLFDRTLAVQRIQAARRAIDASGTGVVLTARSEGFIVGRPALSETLWRLSEYAAAGADCLYAPGLGTMDEIVALVKEVAPKPVNVLVGSPFTTVAALADVGIRRISVGGALARTAWQGMLVAAEEIARHGTFNGLANSVPLADINDAFDAWRDEARG